MTETYQAELTKHRRFFTVKNNGAHLIVEGKRDYIDVWPGTGKWISRIDRTEGFGLRTLLEYLES